MQTLDVIYLISTELENLFGITILFRRTESTVSSQTYYLCASNIIFIMYTFETSIRVRYGETDQMGYVYYGNYPLYYEVGRTEMLRSLELSYRAMEEEDILLPVHSLNIKYIEPAKYDDLLTLRVILKELPTAKIHFYYEVYNEQKRLLNTGETVLVFVDAHTRRPRRAPEVLLTELERYFPG